VLAFVSRSPMCCPFAVACPHLSSHRRPELALAPRHRRPVRSGQAATACTASFPLYSNMGRSGHGRCVGASSRSMLTVILFLSE
jgi:hypothetical protein